MRKLIVVEKPSVVKQLRPYLVSAYQVFNLDFYGYVIHSDANNMFYKHTDGWYEGGRKTDLEPLTLPDFEIPADTYLVSANDMNIASSFFEDEFFMDQISSIIFIMDRKPESECSEQILAARRYLSITGYPLDQCQCCFIGCGSKEEITDGLAHPYTFPEIYVQARRRLIRQKFQCPVQPKNKFERILNLSRMSLTKFCAYFHIPRRTAENWKYSVSDCPEYYLELMEYKLLHEGLI